MSTRYIGLDAASSGAYLARPDDEVSWAELDPEGGSDGDYGLVLSNGEDGVIVTGTKEEMVGFAGRLLDAVSAGIFDPPKPPPFDPKKYLGRWRS